MEDTFYDDDLDIGSADQSVASGIDEEHTRNMTMNIT
jgi:hypothetical protein